MMIERQLIRLPWPPAKASANGSQGDFHGKARARKSYKTSCAWECTAQRIKAMTSASCVEVTFHPPRNGKVDWDNLVGRAKQGFDAVSEAIGVDDSEWRFVVVRVAEKVKDGCVLIDVKA